MSGLNASQEHLLRQVERRLVTDSQFYALANAAAALSVQTLGLQFDVMTPAEIKLAFRSAAIALQLAGGPE